MSYQEQDIDLENLDQLVKDYFARGGVITECEKYARSENVEYTVGWGKKKKKVVDPSVK